MKTGNLCSLHSTMAAMDNPEHFKSCLLDLSHSPWQGLDKGKFETKYQGIKSSIKKSGISGLSQLFDLYLITKLLLDENPPAWVKPFILSNIEIKQYLGTGSDQLEGSSWKVVPVVLTGTDHVYIRKFMVGRLTCGPDPGPVPEWANPLFDREALESARTTLDFVTGQSTTDQTSAGYFMFYPVAMADSSQVQFKGRSASLSLALGFKSLLKGTPISNKVICTGVLNNRGEIEQVGGIQKKYDEFQNKDDFRCLFYPGSNRIKDHEKDKLSIPVKTFDQAWMIASLYSEKHQNQLFLLTKILDNPGFFVDHLENLPWEWISWINQEKKAVHIINTIADNPGLLNIFTKKFESTVESCDTDKSSAISELISGSMLDRINIKAPISALRWCTFNLSLANHLGKVHEWQHRGMALVNKVKKLDIDLVATFFNNCLVASHNRFEFTPELPLPMKEILEFLQARYKTECNFGCTVNLVLGKLYGTLMQNYAFCGPEYIRETKEYSQKALTALGVNLAFEYKAEWIRQYSYLTLALLDLGDFKGAEKSLEQYLETEEFLFCLDQLSCWEFALVCRFFSQVKDHPLRKNIYQKMLSTINSKIEKSHPWQLCTYNLGLIALDSGDEKNALSLLEKSLDICLSEKSGPTIQVMALLPLSLLSGLYKQTGNTDFNKIMDEAKQKILTASTEINDHHFAFLREIPFEKALAKVRENPAGIFPFSYR